MKIPSFNISISLNKKTTSGAFNFLVRITPLLITMILSAISSFYFFIFYHNGLGLSYNDARSHLDIGRRVVEGLKPGIAQLGSVWLPLNHLLMVPTIWNDWMWHSGLSGAIQSMMSFVVTGLIIYSFLRELHVGLLGRIVGVMVFIANLNVLYLQSTAMTELLLLATMTIGVYELLLWSKKEEILHLIKSAFWVMLATMVRYDGWFLILYCAGVIALISLRKKGYKTMEGTIILFLTLASLGIALWFLWNQLIFKDALYFAIGPFSARAQQEQMERAGVLATKGNFLLSLKVYLYAMIFNSGALITIFGVIGAFFLWMDQRISKATRLVSSALFAPFLFNILALTLGFSVLFIQNIAGDTWFNVRYGIMMAPSIAIFCGYLVERLKPMRWMLIGLILFSIFFSLVNQDAVTIDDARVGTSQKNVSEVSGWLNKNAKDKKGFILISAASHDAIIFSSGLPMKKFIHEGTGTYWESATTSPDRWARWIVMRTYDDNDLTWKAVSKTTGFALYDKVASYPFADIYEIKPQYVGQLNTEPIFGKQK